MVSASLLNLRISKWCKNRGSASSEGGMRKPESVEKEVPQGELVPVLEYLSPPKQATHLQGWVLTPSQLPPMLLLSPHPGFQKDERKCGGEGYISEISSLSSASPPHFPFHCPLLLNLGSESSNGWCITSLGVGCRLVHWEAKIARTHILPQCPRCPTKKALQDHKRSKVSHFGSIKEERGKMI